MGHRAVPQGRSRRRTLNGGNDASAGAPCPGFSRVEGRQVEHAAQRTALRRRAIRDCRPLQLRRRARPRPGAQRQRPAGVLCGAEGERAIADADIRSGVHAGALDTRTGVER